MTTRSIEESIPHRGPMLLIDEVVEQTEDSIICRKSFRADEYFYDGHYPDNPLTPGVILCEVAMQAGAILLSSKVDPESGGKVPVVTRMNNVKFKRKVVPGDTVVVHAKIDEIVGPAFFISAKVMVDSSVAVRLDFGCTLA